MREVAIKPLKITREEMMVILYRFATWQGKGSTEDLTLAPGYDDASQISDWAYP
jgi:hypothetical protein